MHENHQPSCLTCQYFILPFQDDSTLSEWGYCQKKTENHPPKAEELADIVKDVKEGQMERLFGSPIGLYQGEDEWCPLYVEV